MLALFFFYIGPFLMGKTAKCRNSNRLNLQKMLQSCKQISTRHNFYFLDQISGVISWIFHIDLVLGSSSDTSLQPGHNAPNEHSDGRMTPRTGGVRAWISRPNYTHKKDGVDFWGRNRPAFNYVEKRLDVRLECGV